MDDDELIVQDVLEMLSAATARRDDALEHANAATKAAERSTEHIQRLREIVRCLTADTPLDSESVAKVEREAKQVGKLLSEAERHLKEQPLPKWLAKNV